MKNENPPDVYQVVVDNMVAALSDMTKILASTSVEVLEKVIDDMTENLPNIQRIPTATKIESLQKTIQHLVTHSSYLTKESLPLQEIRLLNTLQDMVDTTANMIDLCSIKDSEALQTVLKNVPTTIPRMIKIFYHVDWSTFEPTDEDVQNAQKILNSENIEQAVSDRFKNKEADEELSNVFRTVLLILMLLYYTMEFINNTTLMTVKELTQNKIHPVLETRIKNKQQVIPDERVSKEFKNKLKEAIPTEIIGLFMIVIQDRLAIHETPHESSRIVGLVNSFNIVQFIEQKNDWTRILHDSAVDHSVLEGWVLMKHLRAIK